MNVHAAYQTRTQLCLTAKVIFVIHARHARAKMAALLLLKRIVLFASGQNGLSGRIAPTIVMVLEPVGII
jgi:hypothetical protein